MQTTLIGIEAAKQICIPNLLLEATSGVTAELV
ncbi:unnamed protein product [Tetraodon nigroviridis]|uniref:(spotted green pufferfish) hypothetical protein n=1 Tax=Tetraodon nigroviridis TaxID=99883 RepID=Q4RQ08_TETNG|nr:unnamed protein product [Tetraodon nigroviridis]